MIRAAMLEALDWLLFTLVCGVLMIVLVGMPIWLVTLLR